MRIPKERGICPGSDVHFCTPSERARRVLFYPESCGHYYTDRDYHICREDFGNCLLFYICGGELTVRSQGVTATARAGQVVFLNCHLPHEYCSTRGAEFLWLHLDGSNTQQIWEDVCREQGGFVFDTPRAEDIKDRIFEIICACRNEQLPHETHLSEKLYSLLIACLGRSDPDAALRENTPIYAAIQYIRANYAANLTLEDMARQASMSKYHFSRLFKETCGYSPHEFLILTRLNRAKQLLTTTDLPISRIAQEVGYQNAASFSSVFANQVGLSPTRFRQYTL